MNPEQPQSILLFYVKKVPCETATGALTVKCTQQGDRFHLVCAYRLGFTERPHFSTDSVGWKMPVERRRAESVLERLRQAHIPAQPDFSAGCDGTIYELGLGGYMGGAVFRWWSSAPPGWEILESMVTSVMEWADAPAALAKRRRT